METKRHRGRLTAFPFFNVANVAFPHVQICPQGIIWAGWREGKRRLPLTPKKQTQHTLTWFQVHTTWRVGNPQISGKTPTKQNVGHIDIIEAVPGSRTKSTK